MSILIKEMFSARFKRYFNQKGIIHLAPLLILVAVLGILAYLFFSSNAPLKDKLFGSLYQKPSSKADTTGTACENTAANTGCMFLSPVTIAATQNNNFQVEIRVNTNGTPINAVEANISFPTNELQYVSADGTNSAFSIEAPTVTGTGTISISRGSVTAVNGEGLVTTLTFKPIVATGVATISVDQTSQTVSSTTNVNIIQGRGNATVNIGSVPSLTPSSSPSSIPTSQTGEFSLVTTAANIKVGDTFTVDLKAKSDTDDVNTFDAKLQFDKDKLEVVNIDPTNSVIGHSLEDFFDNNTGEISIFGGVESPGVKTTGSNTLQVRGIVFRAKALGSALIDILPTSGILRNSDNADILGVRNNLTLNIQAGTTPVCGNGTVESGEACDNGAGNGLCPSNCSSTCQVNVCPTGSPTPSPTSSPTPTCTLTNAVWNITQNPVTEGNLVTLRVTGSAGCDTKQVSFEVREDDSVAGIGGFDPVVNNPGTVSFIGTIAQTSWVAEFQEDGLAGIGNPPEYYFVASLVGGNSTINSSDPKLLVNKAGPTFRKGDGNRDGKVDRTDFSIMMSNWGKTSGMPVEIDMNDDSLINTFDFSALVLVFKQDGIIR